MNYKYLHVQKNISYFPLIVNDLRNQKEKEKKTKKALNRENNFLPNKFDGSLYS